MSSGVLGIAERLRTLASDPEHRHAIVHDQHMLSTLTVFLENSADTPAVRRTTLDTLEYLAMHAPNRLAMRSEPGLSAALLAVAEKTDSGVCARLARSILAAIAETPASAAAAMNADPFETPCKVTERVEVPASLVAQANAAKLRDASVVDHTFFVKGLHGETQRDAVEQSLLTVVGIVSFWFDVYQQKAEVRARCDQATIVDAIAKAGFVAVEWRGEGSPHKLTDNSENKAAASAAAKSSSSNSGANGKDVDYLDEKENVQHSYGSGGWLGTLAIFGAPAPAKKKGGKKEKDTGLLGALASWW